MHPRRVVFGTLHLSAKDQLSKDDSRQTADPYAFTAKDDSVEPFPYQVSMGRYGLLMPLTGNGKSGFDSGEGA